MKYYKFVLFVVVVLVFISNSIHAQDIEKSARTEVVDNKTYYLHTVKQSQTIYGISKAYGVNVSDVYAANPAITSNIQAGMVLRIPKLEETSAKTNLHHIVEKGETLFKIADDYNVSIDELFKVNQDLTTSIKPGQSIIIPLHAKKDTITTPAGLHIVQANETFYSIALKYSISVATLQNLNPGISDILQTGQQLKVPQISLTQPVVLTKNIDSIAIDCSKPELKSEYCIALMIPFYLESSYSVDTANTKSVSTYRSLSFIQFYEGVQLALDSLKRCGFNAKVYVYDVAEDTSKMHNLLAKPEFTKMDLIIGPFFSNNFSIVSRWSKEKKVPIVNPFTVKTDMFEENMYAFKAVPSVEFEAQEYIEFIKSNYPEANIIVAHNDKSQALADSIIHAIKKYPDTKISGVALLYASSGLSGITSNLKADKINIIITLIEGEAFVSSYLRSLNPYSKSHQIILFGTKNWETYSNIDLEYLHNLNLHVCSNYFIDFTHTRVQNMIIDFRDKYKVEPDYYAVQGYDLTLYFSHVLKQYGHHFIYCLDDFKGKSLFNNFQFKAIHGQGQINSGCMIYRFENYRAINARVNPLTNFDKE